MEHWRGYSAACTYAPDDPEESIFLPGLINFKFITRTARTGHGPGEKRCHAYDRDHKRNRCPKECPRKCIRGLHPCRSICGNQPCPPCRERLMHELPCGHQLYDLCSKETAALKCQEKCTTVLACGHPCTGKCSDTCPRCQVKVEKTLNCGHLLEVPCYRREEEADKFRCKATATKMWPYCGHSKEVECRTDVRTTACPEPCGSVLANCGHVCEGTCGECRQGRVHVRCQQKCQQILVCGHACTESCSEGKACGPCTQPCQNSCPHSVCGDPPGKGGKKKGRNRNGRRCGEPCPPCVESCAWNCPHHKCQQEVSSEKGEKTTVAIKCWEPCTRPRCKEACNKLIKCSKTAGCKFQCRGVCEPNEPCLDICPDCQPKEWSEIHEIFFGMEEDEDTLFYRLRDCGHVLAVDGLDQWVETQLRESEGGKATEITVITCPKCKTPIRRSLRYGAEIKTMLADIEHIKRRQLGNARQLKLQKENLLEKQQEFHRLHSDYMLIRYRMNDDRKSPIYMAAETMFSSLKLNSEKPSTQALLRYENSLNLLLELQKIWNKLLKDKRHQTSLLNFSQSSMTTCHLLFRLFGYRVDELETATAAHKNSGQYFVKEWLLQQLFSVADFVSKNKDNASERMLSELEAEVERLELLQEFVLALLSSARKSPTVIRLYQQTTSLTLEPHHLKAAENIVMELNSNMPMGKEKAASVRKAVVQFSKDVGSGGLGISEEERKSIVSAFTGMGKGHWFKCPNVVQMAKMAPGHLYVIGDCGGAMQEGTCPECKARIGGGSHRLRSDNAFAPEMDGAIQPAWPLGHP